MIQSTMTNSDFLELCKDQNIDDPYIMGFYFPNPIPDFRGSYYELDGRMSQEALPVSSCCFFCAHRWYFPRTEEEAKRDHHVKSDEDLALFEKNRSYYLSIFPKEHFNSGVIINLSEANLELFNGEFICCLCDQVHGYF